MRSQRSVKVILSIVLVLMVMIVPTAAVSHAENAARPMQSHDFTDVPVTGQEFMEPFINAFFHQGITGGCSASPLMYCPSNPVTRGSMAVFMGRALGYLDMQADGINARAYFKQTDLSGAATGVVGFSFNSIGVVGRSDTNTGVAGFSQSGAGVVGQSENNFGVIAVSLSGSALRGESAVQSLTDNIFDLELGGTSGELFGSLLHLFSNRDFTFDLDNDDNTGNAGFFIRDGDNATVFTVDEAGNMTATGTKSAIVSTMSYGERKLYAVEATENWFEDFGSAELVDGEAVIEIDPIFAETVNLGEDYHVFFTPIDGSAVLYVTEMSSTSFTVRADDGSTVRFSYRIVAKRLGYEDVRMEEAAP